jgi:hypothetical protein
VNVPPVSIPIRRSAVLVITARSSTDVASIVSQETDLS